MVLAVLPRDQRQGQIDLPMVTSQEEVEWALKAIRDTRVLLGTLAP